MTFNDTYPRFQGHQGRNYVWGNRGGLPRLFSQFLPRRKVLKPVEHAENDEIITGHLRIGRIF